MIFVIKKTKLIIIKSCLEDPFCGWCVDENENVEGCIPGLEKFKSLNYFSFNIF